MKEKISQKRRIDATISASMNDLQSLGLVGNSTVRKWHLLLTALFVAGFVTAVIWMVSTDKTVGIFGATRALVTNKSAVVYKDAAGDLIGPLESDYSEVEVAETTTVFYTRNGRSLTRSSERQVRIATVVEQVQQNRIEYLVVVTNEGDALVTDLVIANIVEGARIRGFTDTDNPQYGQHFVLWESAELAPQETIRYSVIVEY